MAVAEGRRQKAEDENSHTGELDRHHGHQAPGTRLASQAPISGSQTSVTGMQGQLLLANLSCELIVALTRVERREEGGGERGDYGEKR